MLVHEYLGTAKAVPAIMAEITIATADRDGTTVITTRGIGLELGKLALLFISFIKDCTSSLQDGIINSDVHTPRSLVLPLPGPIAIFLAVSVTIGSIAVGTIIG